MAPLYLVFTFVFLLAAIASVFSFLRWRKAAYSSAAAPKDPVLPLFCFFKKHPRASSPGGEEKEGEKGGEGGEGEEGIEAELIRFHNLPGFPRLLFTIKEETTEDMESDDGRSRCDRRSGNQKGSSSMGRSLRELFFSSSPGTSSPHSHASSSPHPQILNPLSPTKMTMTSTNSNRIVGSTPPPEFKFLRDADDKLYMKTLMDEAMKIHHHHHHHR